MPCKVRVRDDLSMADIKRLARKHLVRVTPHVGNWTPARLVLPSLGVHILCVDSTIGLRDINAHPHLYIRDGFSQQICDHPTVLTTHARMTTKPSCCKSETGSLLSEVHIGAVKRLFPDASVSTHNEHLRQTEALTLAVAEEVYRLSPRYLVWRAVSADGEVTTYSREYLQSLSADNFAGVDLFPLKNKRAGVLLHNRVAILMDLIEQSQMGEEPEIYHLSGPDMVRYIDQEQKALSKMYDHVRKRFRLRQESITLNLVPFASFRFATRASQAPACERLCAALAAGSADPQTLGPYVREAYDVFAHSETKNYFSQHDMLALSEQVVVPEMAQEWSMATAAQYLAAAKAAA